MRVFFACAEGSTAVLSGSREYSSAIVDIRATGDVLVCLPDSSSPPVVTEEPEQG